MRILLDTHLLLWSAYEPQFLSEAARTLIANRSHRFFFSSVSIWETAIKQMKRKDVFTADARTLRNGLLLRGDRELALTSGHAVTLLDLPMLHRDPFDRILVAQALHEEMTLATVDAQLTAYDAPVMFVG